MPHLPIAETRFESPLAGCKTAVQQQESCPTCLPSTAPQMSHVAYWRPKKTSLMPHLPLAETSFESPSAGSETAEQQQESCPTCLPSAAPQMSNVAYWRPKKTSLMPHLPLAETSFESPWAGSETAEQQQESCPTCLPSTAPQMSNVAYWHPKKTSLMPHLPLTETSFESPSAGSETAEHQQESCPTCLPSTAPRMSNVAYWRPKRTKLMPHLPLAETSFESPSAGSETAEQQQESCPTCLPSAAPQMSNVAYWRPKKTSLMPHLPLAETSFESPSAGSETAEQQQESCPTCLPSTAPRMSNVAYWRPKKTSLMPHLPLAETSFESPSAGSETAEQQQESCPTCLPSTAPRMSNVAYWRPKKTKLMPHLPLAETSFESPSAGSETAEQQQESCPTCLPSAAPQKCLTLRTDALKKLDAGYPESIKDSWIKDMFDVIVDMSSVGRTFTPDIFVHQCCQRSLHIFSVMRCIKDSWIKEMFDVLVDMSMCRENFYTRYFFYTTNTLTPHQQHTNTHRHTHTTHTTRNNHTHTDNKHNKHTHTTNTTKTTNTHTQ